jgi:hypothetical protein
MLTTQLLLPVLLTVTALGATACNARAQSHATHSAAQHAQAQGTEFGQSALASLAEVARILLADQATDWSRVNLERLRQHLVDMNEVALNARVTQTQVPGGVRAEVEGSGRTRDAIRRMALAHAAQTDLLPGATVTAEASENGAVVVIRARDPNNARTVEQIRGLGFVGLLVLGDHHGPHHVALARGAALHNHD